MFHDLVNPGEFPENPTIFPKIATKWRLFVKQNYFLRVMEQV